jgi:hypothetical protein
MSPSLRRRLEAKERARRQLRQEAQERIKRQATKA